MNLSDLLIYGGIFGGESESSEPAGNCRAVAYTKALYDNSTVIASLGDMGEFRKISDQGFDAVEFAGGAIVYLRNDNTVGNVIRIYSEDDPSTVPAGGLVAFNGMLAAILSEDILPVAFGIPPGMEGIDEDGWGFPEPGFYISQNMEMTNDGLFWLVSPPLTATEVTS